jgi:phage protein D
MPANLPSPLNNATGPVTLTVWANGKPISDTYPVVSVQVTNSINRISSAKIELVDGDIATGTFPISDADDFNPGDLIEIYAGYDSKTALIFSGIVSKHAIRILGDNEGRLVLDCRDKAHEVTTDRKSALFVDQTDSEVLTAIINSYGISNTIEETLTKQVETVQYNTTDWDFIVNKAIANDMVVIAALGKVIIRKPDMKQAAQLSLVYGESIMTSDLEISTQSATPVGTLSFQGYWLPLGTMVELGGLGKRFNGNAYVSEVNHNIADGNWVTEIQVGLKKAELPVDQMISGMAGLQSGIVSQMDNDPNGEYRVLVEPSYLNGGKIWARMTNQYLGSFFYPEIGDEVLFGFLNNDSNYPLVLGSMYGKTNVPPFVPDSRNSVKGFTTKSGLQLSFDDDSKVTSITTPGGNNVTLSDDEKLISLKDRSGNSVVLSPKGIDICSATDLNLVATGDVTINATGKIMAVAKQDMLISGLNIIATAQVVATLKGNATAELSASGQTTVKGAIVMIN